MEQINIGEDCQICQDIKVSNDKMIDCGHYICIDCLKQLQKLECPICRSLLKGGYFTS